MNPETHWTLGVLIGLPIAIIVAFAVLVVAVIAGLAKEWGTLAGCLGVLAVIAIITGFAFWPYESEYHQWRPHHGTIAAVQSRLVSAGDNGMNQKFVVRFEGNHQEYAVEDTRASLLKKGDKLTISCKKTWQWSAAPGYDCRWWGSE